MSVQPEEAIEDSRYRTTGRGPTSAVRVKIKYLKYQKTS